MRSTGIPTNRIPTWIERYRDEAALREHERRLREAGVIDKVRPFWASPPRGMRLEPVAAE
jgi:quinol monooxygenase YgiN